eukprot:SAG22_NODE_7776_length_709_cov_1.377049_1_plen_35_part_10
MDAMDVDVTAGKLCKIEIDQYDRNTRQPLLARQNT